MENNKGYGLTEILTDTSFLLARVVVLNLANKIVNIFLEEYPLKNLQKLQELFDEYNTETNRLTEEIKNHGNTK